MMKSKPTVFLLALLFTVVSLSAQNRAPSLYLNYQDDAPGDIIINTLRVASPSPLYTYYCGLLWNSGQDAGGYCGMQEHPAGRNFIYSLWDPITSSDTITADYAHPSTELANFGGEGTGLRSLNFGIGWETDQWYSLVSRAWSTDNKYTYFGYWVFDQHNKTWHHLVTMKYPVPNLKFNTRTSSFIEDWLGNGQQARTVHHQNGWKRKTADNSWLPFDESYFDRVYPDAGTVNYIDNYDGGVIDSAYYFMTSGGTTMPVTNEANVLLHLPVTATEPGFPAGAIENLLLEADNENLKVSWDVVDSLSPQYSYHLRIYDNVQLIGVPLVAFDHIKPHFRNATVDISNLPNNQEYFVRFYTKDIFDQESAAIVAPFVKGTFVGVNRTELGGGISLFPNPVADTLNLLFQEQIQHAEIQIFDMEGRLISQKKIKNTKAVTIPISAPGGLYFLKIRNGSSEKTWRFVKK
ncbi:MAG: DUF3472 domain-containing protein [Lewinellaceae bacterium]|nr:DUF3472 domain-containing protein [Lewinellaceae bacterium]